MASPTDLRNALDKLGLGFLFDVMSKAVIDPTVDVTDENQLTNAINSDPAAKAQLDQRFIGNKYRVDAGLRPLKPNEYLTLEQQYVTQLQNAGMPPGFYDTPQDLAKLIGGDVSPVEFRNRIDVGYKAALNAPQQVKAQLQTLYGVTDADLAAYYLDPTKAEDVLGRKKSADLYQRQLQAAQIAAQAQQQAGMPLGVQTAEQLAAQGISGAEAQQGFTQIGQSQQLYETTVGETNAPGQANITQAQQIAGTFGTEAAARQAIAERRRRRQAAFEAGGSLAATQQGVTGLRTVGQ